MCVCVCIYRERAHFHSKKSKHKNGCISLFSLKQDDRTSCLLRDRALYCVLVLLHIFPKSVNSTLCGSCDGFANLILPNVLKKRTWTVLRMPNHKCPLFLPLCALNILYVHVFHFTVNTIVQPNILLTCLHAISNVYELLLCMESKKEIFCTVSELLFSTLIQQIRGFKGSKIAKHHKKTAVGTNAS